MPSEPKPAMPKCEKPEISPRDYCPTHQKGCTWESREDCAAWEVGKPYAAACVEAFKESVKTFVEILLTFRRYSHILSVYKQHHFTRG